MRWKKKHTITNICRYNECDSKTWSRTLDTNIHAENDPEHCRIWIWQFKSISISVYYLPQTSSLPSFSPPMILLEPEYLLSTPHLHPATLARGVAAINKINLLMTKYQCHLLSLYPYIRQSTKTTIKLLKCQNPRNSISAVKTIRHFKIRQWTTSVIENCWIIPLLVLEYPDQNVTPVMFSLS